MKEIQEKLQVQCFFERRRLFGIYGSKHLTHCRAFFFYAFYLKSLTAW